MSDWLIDFALKLGGALLVIGTLMILVFSAAWRKRTTSSFKNLTKIGSKIGNNVAKSGKERYLKATTKKPVFDRNQLPGGIGYGNKSQPATTTPQKIPKQGGSIPIPATTVIDMVDCEHELIYTNSCGGYELGDEYNGRSIAFKCVGGWDKKTGKLKIWLYDYHYHKDTRNG